MLVCSVYITWPKQFKTWKVPAVVGTIMVVGAPKQLYSMHDLKATQINVQRSLI